MRYGSGSIALSQSIGDSVKMIVQRYFNRIDEQDMRLERAIEHARQLLPIPMAQATVFNVAQ